MDITITLTTEQEKALKTVYGTDVEVAMQDFIAGRADRIIREIYEKAFESKDITDMKTLLPNVKVG